MGVPEHPRAQRAETLGVAPEEGLESRTVAGARRGDQRGVVAVVALRQ